MVNSNKILTVSYGTFSCTLEGFDDSFGTMKAIAEYFRDLAADDRYFGAEPPQPDADMLARIAQREVARRVDALEAPDGGIALRAQDRPSEASATALATAETAPVTDDIQSQTVISEEPETSETSAADTAPVTPPAPEPVLSEPEDEVPAEPEPIQAAAPVADPVESIAAKLQRIRAVVAQESTTASDYSEDEHADEVMAEEHLADAARDITEALAIDDDVTEEDLDDLDDDAEPTDEAISGAEFEEDLDDVSDADDPAAQKIKDRLKVLKVKRKDIDSALAMGVIEPIDGPEADEDEDQFDDEFAAEAEADGELVDEPARALSYEDEEDLLRELAALEAEFQESVQKPSEDEVSDSNVFTEDDAGEEANDAEDESWFEDEDEVEDFEVEAEPAFEQSGARTDDAVTRLMAEANEKMEEPEGTSRREAYSALRAAVKAAEVVAGSDEDADEAESYRKDLENVVQPNRPRLPAEPREHRPGKSSKPAPLKLVAEQRVDDLPERTTRPPVRPRRVSSRLIDLENPTDQMKEKSDFAQYVEDRGANELSEMLEAAASYLSFVEGIEQFSRPDLMNKVRQVHGDGFNREDSLRSFGQLLREGKIEKLRGGRFTAGEQIGFRPDERAAG